ncbi:MAG: LamG-like jellyroll fold domain-containing protein, partial [Planctomycetota bacterium]
MCRRLLSLIFLALVLGVAGGAGADNVDWTNNQPGNNSWCNLYNWDPEGIPSVPPPADVVFVSQVLEEDAGNHQGISPDRGPVIGTGCAALAASIHGPNPEFGHTQVIDINGTGTLDVTSDWLWRTGIGEAIVNVSDSAVVNVGGMWRGTDNGISIINIDGNPTITVDGVLRGGDEAGSFYFNMSGGYVEIGEDSEDEFAIGDNGGGEINVSGGKIICHGEMDMGGLRGSAEITVNMTAPGGLIRVESPFRFPGSASRAGSVFMNLDAGAIDCNEFHHGGSDGAPWTDDWLVDIEGGELRIWGDVRAAIDANVAAGQITAYDGEGEVLIQLIDGNTVVTGIPPDPNTASDPYPPHRSTLIEPNVVCHWTPGIQATSHDVYFGTDFDDVNDATTSDDPYQGNVEPNEWDPNGTGDLDLSTTYYWRIDERNGGVFKGRVWRFTIKSPIEDPNRKVWYKLDEADGYTAYDSSGYEHHGAVDGNELLWDPNDGHHPDSGGSRAFNFSGDDAETVIDVPPTVLDTMGSGVTIIVWLKDNFGNTENWVFGTGVGGEDGPYHVQASAPNDTGTVFFRAGNDTNDVLEADLKAHAEWHHYAFVKDESKDEMYIYFDSKELASKTGVDDTLSNVVGAAFKLGSVTWSSNYEYEGKMDDFKVFDYAMDAAGVAAEFRGGNLADPWAPDPGNYEQDVPRDANLAWRPGDYAVQHRVYLGTDWDDVNDADTSSAGIYRGQQDPCEYDPPGYLELDKTYYWRIDEVNDNDPCVWKGPIWQFTVANYLIIDNFESYDDDNRIYFTWEDGVV